MGASLSSSDGFVSEINVTPFVDVMLVLLVIFMVTAPMMTEGLDVELPQVQTVEVLPTENDHMVLSIKDDSSLFLDEYPTTLQDLESVIKTNVLVPNKQLFLRADKNVSYGVVMDVMSRIRGAGVEKLGMVAESAPPGAISDPAAAPPTTQPNSPHNIPPNTIGTRP